MPSPLRIWQGHAGSLRVFSGRLDALRRSWPFAHEGRLGFEIITQKGAIFGADVMVASCLSEEGSCLCEMERLEEAAAAVEEAVRRAERRGADRAVAVDNANLGTGRLLQERHPEAHSAYREVPERFTRRQESGSVATTWHQVGMVNQPAGDLHAAERAFNQALVIMVRLGLHHAQSRTLSQLGHLYTDDLQQLETAVAF